MRFLMLMVLLIASGYGSGGSHSDQLVAGMQYDPTKLLESGAIVCGVHIVCNRRT